MARTKGGEAKRKRKDERKEESSDSESQSDSMNEEEEKERQTPKKKGTSTPKGSPKTSPPREDKKKKDKKREKRGHKRSRTRRDDEDEDEEEEDQPVKTPGSVVQVRCSCFLRSALVFALPLHLLLIVRLGQRCVSDRVVVVAFLSVCHFLEMGGSLCTIILSPAFFSLCFIVV